MNDRECETCIKKKTVYCPNSCKCYETETKPYYQNRIMLLEENQKLKKQLKEQDYTSVYLKGCTDTKGKYLSQQKKFIEYLENEINMCDVFLETIKSDLEELTYAGRVAGKTYITTQIMKNETAKKICEEILSKYKEIIGSDNK